MIAATCSFRPDEHDTTLFVHIVMLTEDKTEEKSPQVGMSYGRS